MKNKTTVISTVLCLLPIVLSVTLYQKLPDQIAVHFNSAGQPDNYLPKAVAAFGLPVLMAIINLYSQFRITQDPKVDHASISLRNFSRWLIPIISLVIIPVTLFMALGKAIPVVMLSNAIVGLVIVVSGNYLPKCKRNYTIGIKLPWTLDSEDNWNQTHRFAGFVWVVGGIIILLNAFLNLLGYVTPVIIALLVILPFIYSYLFYKKQ